MIRRQVLSQLVVSGALAACGRSGAAGTGPTREEPVGARPILPLRAPSAFSIAASAVTAAAVVAADRIATERGGTLVLPPGRYHLPLLRLNAPAVRFQPGAMVVPAAGDALIAFAGRVVAARQRIFEIAERPGGEPAITLPPQVVYPEWWGAQAGGDPHLGHDDSLAWQQALDAVSARGGIVQAAPGRTYPLRYPLVVLGRDVAIDLAGACLLTDLARAARAPACVLLVGDSREWNSRKVRERRLAGDLFNNFENPAFQDIGMRTEPDGTAHNIAQANFPAPADPGVGGFTARYCSVSNGQIAYYDDVVSPGNYGIQFCNAADSSAQALHMRNVGQGFGFGSDMAPRVPYAVRCQVRDIVVERVNPAHTYYGAGFHGYARECHDEAVVVRTGAQAGTPDGNLWAANFALACTSTNSGGVCGRGTNAEGFAIGAHARRCVVRGASVRDAARAFVNFGPLDAPPADGSAFIDCTARDVDYLIALESRNARFEDVHGSAVSRAEVKADNLNATGNVLLRCDVARIDHGAVPLDQVLRANRIQRG